MYAQPRDRLQALRRTVRLLVAIALVAALTAGCSASGRIVVPTAQPPRPRTATTTTTTTTMIKLEPRRGRA
jgi:hypothetical protein